MASLLRLAPELRDMILQEVLFQTPREPPANPTSSQNRTRRRYSEDAKCSDGHDIWVEREPFFLAAAASSSQTPSSSSPPPPSNHQTPPVLLVNRQLYHEAAGILARRGRRLRYCLDVMYVKECGLWPTWLDLPRLARRVDEIHASFRVFDPPTDVDPDWRNRRQLVANGDGGPPMLVWNFFALLKDYLRYGPSAFEALVARPPPGTSGGFTVGRLVLDVLPPPPGTKDDSLGLPRGRLAADRHMLDAFARGRHAKYWPLPSDAFPHLMVAEKMAFFIASKIAGLLAMYDDYGRCLYEHVGAIEIRVAGSERRTFDLDELMGMLPPIPIQAHSPAATARKQKAFDEWKAATIASRATWR